MFREKVLRRLTEFVEVSKSEFHHVPVLLVEVLEGLCLFSGARVLDCTLGGGGHSRAILDRVGPSGFVTALDCDAAALEAAARRFSGVANFCAHRVNFGELGEGDWLQVLGVQDAVLMDLGVSSPQLDIGLRGFSIRRDGPLDMRMDSRQSLTAAEVVSGYPESELRRIFFEFGEERLAGKAARRIVHERSLRPIESTGQLVRVLESVLGSPRPGRIHPATKIFQALRMEVNSELERLRRGLESVLALLRPGGRLVVLAYHSLEDRVVKRFFQEGLGRCRCPRGVPVCGCGARPVLRLVGSKAVRPGEAELGQNPRARSVRMRVAEKL